MDGTGLSALLVGLGLGVAACGDAAADGTEPGPPAAPVEVLARIGVKPPADWVRLAEVEAVATAAAATITGATTAVEAWGDPAAGCYAIAIDSRGAASESIAASAARLAKGLAPLGVDPAAMPAPVDDVLDAELPIATAELAGSIRIRMYRTPDKFPQGIALACAANPREPARCKTQCQALIIQLAPPVAP
jgi:hypothetical protein